MGNTALQKHFEYNTPVNNPDRAKNETSIFRNPDMIGKNLETEVNPKPIQEYFRERFEKYPNDQGFGRRIYDKATKTYTNNVEWMTNAQFREKAEQIGSGLLTMGLVPITSEVNKQPIRFAGIYAKNSLEYFIFDTACIFYGITVVPIYDTLGEEATLFAFRQTEMQTCAVSAIHGENIIKQHKLNKSFAHLKSLIVLDPENLKPELKNEALSIGIRVLTFEEILEGGRINKLPWADTTLDTIYAFSYTSGTTGEPKAAMLSNRNMSTLYISRQLILALTREDVHLSYLPMAHVMERCLFITAMCCFSQICIFSGDVLKLKEDLAIFRPTLFASVPRLYNKFYDAILAGIKEKGAISRALYNRALKSKLYNLEHYASYEHCFYDRLIFNKVKLVLGGRVRLMITGSAPISSEVMNFLKVNFCVPLLEAYGQTEVTALGSSTSPNDPTSGHVGGVPPHVELKLVDVPEMNYTSQDKDENGNPAPRGEIWFRAATVIPGYYKQPEKNAETFTPDGWLMSGDVGMIYSDKRRLKIIDRKKNIFKLAQGEYIAPEKLENIYKLAHSSIASVYIYGDSLKSCLVGVICVEKPSLLKFAAEFNIQGNDAQELAKKSEVKKKYIELLDQSAKVSKLNSLERVKDVYIEVENWQALGLLTEAFKLKRNDGKNHYKAIFDEMYTKLN